MKTPFLDLTLQHKVIKKEIFDVVNRSLKRGDFILGEDAKLFEKEFAAFCDVKYAVGVSSGTAALFLALAALDIKSGDEVIVPDFTFIATSLAVSYVQAKPVFVDINENSYAIDPDKIRKAITKKTKAIIPVHLYGHPVNMPEILKIAKEFNLKVIEDTAQAHGALIKMPDGSWRKAGSLGDIGCFSFYPTKNLGALGDGGMITTNNEDIYKKILMLRDYGRSSRYEHTLIGYNSRLDTIQAGILRAKLKRLDSWNQMRLEAASIYSELLKGLPGVITPGASALVKHVYHCYVLRLKQREKVMKDLSAQGVVTLIHYPIPLHLQPVYRYLGYKVNDFPISEKIAQEIVSLPIYPYIKKAQIKFICQIIKKSLS